MKQCGGCTLCCKIPAISVLKKPSDSWCKHCAVGAGCTVYDQRPKVCAEFSCLWLSSDMPEEFRPDKLHFYIAGNQNDEVLKIRVDTEFPDAWKGHFIVNELLSKGRHLLIVVGHQLTFISAPGRPMPEKLMLEWIL